MPPDEVAVAVVYPELLGTYGDSGNALVLTQRLRWRGQVARVVDVPLGSAVPRSADIYVVGGAEDSAQVLAASLLHTDGGLQFAAAAGRPLLALCAGFQIIGRSFEAGGHRHAGLGLLDVDSRMSGALPRAVGELVAVPTADGLTGLPPITGYENHGGRTSRGPGTAALARVVIGTGNGDGTDGAVTGSVVATYAHGPVLARNPALADLLLTRLMGPLPPLTDDEEEALRAERLASATARPWTAALHAVTRR